MFTSRLSAHPRRTLLAVLLFVVVAGVIGGPVAGRLTSSGGFVAPGADSQLAAQSIVAATGVAPDAGVVVLVDHPTPARVRAAADRLGEIRGVVRTATPGRGLVTGTLSARASEDGVANAALDAFAGRRDVSVGGSVVADLQIGSTVGHDGPGHVPRPERDQRGLRLERLRAQPRHRPGPRPVHRLHAVPPHALPGG